MKISLKEQSKRIFFAVLFTALFAGSTIGQTYPEWQNDKTYNAGDIIKYEDSLYIAICYVYLNTPPPDTWFWKEYSKHVPESEQVVATLFAKHNVDREFLTGYTYKALKYSDITEENTRSFDSHNAYNPETGLYTIPKSGYYHLDIKVYHANTESIQDNGSWILELMVNNSKIVSEQAEFYPPNGASMGSHIDLSINLKLNEGDTIFSRARWRSGDGVWVNEAFNGDYFSIHLIN